MCYPVLYHQVFVERGTFSDRLPPASEENEKDDQQAQSDESANDAAYDGGCFGVGTARGRVGQYDCVRMRLELESWW